MTSPLLPLDDCPVAVKPLEWRENTEHDEDGGAEVVGHSAKHPFGNDYWTERAKPGVDANWTAHHGVWVDLGHFNTEAEAMSAAQADYAQRIRSALVPVAAPVAAGSDEVEPGELTESITKTLANLGCDWRSGQPFFMDPDVKVMAILRKALASITADKAEIARLDGEFHRRGVKIIEMTEQAGAYLCRAEASESRCAAVMAERDGMAEATDAKIEAVARAIYDNAAKRMKRPIAWEDAPSQRRLWAMSDARAALEA